MNDKRFINSMSFVECINIYNDQSISAMINQYLQSINSNQQTTHSSAGGAVSPSAGAGAVSPSTGTGAASPPTVAPSAAGAGVDADKPAI